MNSIKLISLAALATSLMPSWAAQKQNKPNIIFAEFNLQMQQNSD